MKFIFNKKFIAGFIVGALIFSGLGVFAATSLLASQVTYNDGTVEDALNDIYTKVTSGNYCSNLINKTWNFTAISQTETFDALCSGTYEVELWGAQGGWNGGYGGYTKITVDLNANDYLVINVGGAGLGDGSHAVRAGGFNGGGNSNSDSDGNTRQGSGGGATSVALNGSKTAQLATYGDAQTAAQYVLAVAGGGGGRSTNAALWASVAGGNGGGFTGNNGGLSKEGSQTYQGYGGTQLAGGGDSKNVGHGSFGQGASCSVAGGGGGWYGGGCAFYSGGGGSGFINTNKINTGYMACYECEPSSEDATKTNNINCHDGVATSDCAKEGSGAIKIKLISLK